MLQCSSGKNLIGQLFHSHQVTLRALWYAPPVRIASNLLAVAFESVQSIEDAIKTCWIVRIRIGPWLSLWESCRRRRLRGPWQSRSACTLSVLASLGHLSQRERQGGRLSESAPCTKRYSRPVLWDESSSCFVVPPKFGNSLGISLTCAEKRAARPGDFGAAHLIRLLGGRPSRGGCKSLSAKRLSLWAAQNSRYCFRVVAVYRIDFLFFIMIRQSRSPRCSPRISISAVARLVAQGTLYVSHRRSVRMMR